MTTPGARAELIRELRRIGPKCTDAAEYLGLTVITLSWLPFAFMMNVPECVLLTESGADWPIWAGIALFMATEMGLNVDEATLYEVALVMDRKSGTFLALEIA